MTISHRPRRTGYSATGNASTGNAMNYSKTWLHLHSWLSSKYAVKMIAHQSQADSLERPVLPVAPRQQEENTEGSSAGRRINEGAGRKAFKAALYMPTGGGEHPKKKDRTQVLKLGKAQ